MVLTLLRDPRRRVSDPLTPTKTPTRPRSLHGYTSLARRNWLTSVAVIAASLAIGLGFHFASDAEYTARTDIVVVAVSDLTLNGERTVDVSIDSAVQLLLSDRVLGQTARSLNYPGGATGLREDVTVSPIINSRILQLFVSAPEARIAHSAVSALADNFLKMRRNSLTAAGKDRAKAIAAQQAILKRSIQTGAAITDGPDADFDIGKLNRERVQLEAELTALNIHEPDPGYISKAAVIPERGQRQGLSVQVGSGLAAGMTVASGLAALKLHRGTPRHRKKEGAP
jgi:capsular polysaccharide biosynthesis protein